MKKIYKYPQSIAAYNHLKTGYAGHIDSNKIDDIVESHNNIDISIVRPYRVVDGLISQLATDNLDDYYVLPRHMDLNKANHSKTYIYTAKIKTDNTDRKYYCYMSDFTFILTDTCEDLIKLINFDYSKAIIGVIESWRKSNPNIEQVFKNTFEKIYEDINKYIDITNINYLTVGKKTFERYWMKVDKEVYNHTSGRVYRNTSDPRITRPKLSGGVLSMDLCYYSKLSQRFHLDFVKIPGIITDNLKIRSIKILKTNNDITYTWSCRDSDEKHIITGNTQQDLYKEVNKYINEQIERIIKEL